MTLKNALLSLEEASDRLKMNPKQLKDRARRGRVPCIRVTPHALAFLESDIEELLRMAMKRRRWPAHWEPDPLDTYG